MKSHRRVPISPLLSLLGVVLLAGACESAPVRVWRGARHYSAGTDALAAGQAARAVAELQQAAVLVPRASEVRNHLGLAYLADGRDRDARAAFESALELDCGNWAARQNLETLQEVGSAIQPLSGLMPPSGPSGRASVPPFVPRAILPTEAPPTEALPREAEEDFHHGG